MTLEDFKEEKETTTVITTKEDLLGTKVRYEGKEQWEIIKAVCLVHGVEQGTWSGCKHLEGNSVAKISHSSKSFISEKVISLKDTSWEEDSKDSSEFQNLRELKFSDFEKALKPEQEPVKDLSPKYKYTPVEVKSIFDLKDMFNNGELYFKALGDRDDNSFGIVYDKIAEEGMLFTRYYEKRLLKREEIKWQGEVESYLHSCKHSFGTFGILDSDGDKLSVSDNDFLEAARIALRTIGEL